MQLSKYITKDHKQMRYGYTTGSCAAAAAKAATIMLLTKKEIKEVELDTPKKFLLNLSVEHIEINDQEVTCAIKKDSGDDPDITNQSYIYVRVKKTSTSKIEIDGGIGVGRVTKPGLDCKIGEAAINRVPKIMITQAVEETCTNYHYHEGIHVLVFVPNGEELAKKTFNPRLGIVGGISILGTSGIVEPMSEDAIIETIRSEIKIQAASGKKYLLITPGNYGESFIKKETDLNLNRAIKCSNYIGETLNIALEYKMLGVLFIGHLGKVVKVSGGMMNTHSKYGDCRMELLCAHAIRCQSSIEPLQKLVQCNTIDDAITVLDEFQLRRQVLESILEQVQKNMARQVLDHLEIGVITFSLQYGLLSQTRNAHSLINLIKEDV